MASKKSLTDFKALTFDCYGTLIDWETGMINAISEIEGFKNIDSTAIMKKFGELETIKQQEHPTYLYPQILELVIDDLAKAFGVSITPEQRTMFGQSIGSWPPFKDSPQALATLQKYYKLVVLSNVDRQSFSKSQELLGVKFDRIITAQDVGSYKPDLNNFRQLLAQVKENFGIEKENVLHVFNSLYHDALPANQMGIATAYIERNVGVASPTPTTELHLDFTFKTLGDLADAREKL